MWALDDTLVAYDAIPPRISVFSEHGDLLGGFSLREAVQGIAAWPLGVDVFSDGSLVLLAQRITNIGALRTGIVRERALLLRCVGGGAPCDTVREIPGGETFVYTFEGGYDAMPAVLGRGPVFAAADKTLYSGSGDTYRIGRYSATGDLELMIITAHSEVPVTEREWQLSLDARLKRARDGAERRNLRSAFRHMSPPNQMPAYDRFLVDPEGNLWVSDYTPPGLDRPGVWSVFDSDGILLAEVESPPRLELHQVGLDWVLGVWRDHSDIEHVRLYPFHRQTGSGSISTAESHRRRGPG